MPQVKESCGTQGQVSKSHVGECLLGSVLLDEFLRLENSRPNFGVVGLVNGIIKGIYFSWCQVTINLLYYYTKQETVCILQSLVSL